MLLECCVEFLTNLETETDLFEGDFLKSCFEKKREELALGLDAWMPVGLASKPKNMPREIIFKSMCKETDWTEIIFEWNNLIIKK